LDHTDFFISIRSKKIRKRIIAVITVILIIAGTPLIATIETTATLKIKSNQINPSKSAENILNLKVRFYNDVIVIKKSDDIDIITLNDKAVIPGTTTLETSQPVN